MPGEFLMDVVTIGHASIDKVRIDGGYELQLGGAAIYSAMAAKIFNQTGVVSRVGKDFPQDFFMDIKRAGIDIRGIKKVRGKSTNFVIEYAKDGTAVYKEYSLNVGVYIRPRDIPQEYLNAKAFHLAPMASTKQASFIKFLRKKTDALISLNTHLGYLPRYRKEIIKLIPMVDVFSLNEEEAVLLTKTKRLGNALSSLKKMKHNLIVVTIGIDGSAIIEKGETTLSATPYQQKILDLTGCGDSFAGAFISSYLKTGNPLKSANIANTVASINATNWSYRGIKNLKFKSIERFQEFVISRQKRITKNQKSIDHFF
jgi:sugar/nucleoside kinase (ribokinase family)